MVSLVFVFWVVFGIGIGSPSVDVVSLVVVCCFRTGVGCGGFVLFFAFGIGPGFCSGAKNAMVPQKRRGGESGPLYLRSILFGADVVSNARQISQAGTLVIKIYNNAKTTKLLG